MLECFELVGGIPRLALWANDEKNYGKFLDLLMRLAPKEASAEIQGSTIEYVSNLGPSRIVREDEAVEGDASE